MPTYTLSKTSTENDARLIKTVKSLLNEDSAYAKDLLTVDEKLDTKTLTRLAQFSTLNNISDKAGFVSTQTIVVLTRKHGPSLLMKGYVSAMGNIAAIIPFIGIPLTLINIAPMWLCKFFVLGTADNNTKPQVNADTFLAVYRENFTEYLPSGTGWHDDFKTFVGYVNDDAAITDKRWAAYLFATAMHEGRAAADKWKATWKPIAETGGASKDYGNMQTVTDWEGKPLDANGQIITNPKTPRLQQRFYGRGYVQITHQDNYRSMDEALGKGNLFVTNPDLILTDSRLAYDTLSYGLRNGSYRGSGRKRIVGQGYIGGHKLADYFTAAASDYVGARGMVNGDGATNGVLIAGYAKIFQVIFDVAATGA